MALPTPQLEYTEEPNWSLVTTEFPHKIDHLLRQPKKRRIFSLNWPEGDPTIRDQIRAEMIAQKGAAGLFSYTPPGGSPTNVSFMEDSLTTTVQTAVKMSISVKLKEAIW